MRLGSKYAVQIWWFMFQDPCYYKDRGQARNKIYSERKKSSLWFNPWTEHYLGFFLCAWTGHGLMTSKCAKTHTMFAQCSLLQVWHMIEIFELWYFKVPDWFLKALESKLYQIALLLMQYVTASSKQFLQRELHFYKFLPSM